jgi:CheY-like chemotaxis protein
MKVAVAESGPIALELLGRHRFDLVILDLRLPDMDGFQVLEAIRKNPNTARTPVVIYTARRLTAEERARLQGKVQAVVPKGDFNRDRFIELVHKRGERRRRAGGTRADRPAA